MVKRSDVYKCHEGITVEIMRDGSCVKLDCCGQPMELQSEKTVQSEGAKEKHVPVLEKSGSGSKVKVGAVPHPMEADHYIEWIEVINGDYVNRRYLKPGQAPESEFYVPVQPGLVVRAYCNKHGLWRA
jgi:superoxide reductase